MNEEVNYQELYSVEETNYDDYTDYNDLNREFGFAINFTEIFNPYRDY